MDLGLGARACIITGASGGIGGVVARTLAAEGAAVLLVGRRQEALAENARICIEQAENAGRTARVRTLALDLRRPAAAAELVTACVEGFGSVDVLVNCAGTSGAEHRGRPAHGRRLAGPVGDPCDGGECG